MRERTALRLRIIAGVTVVSAAIGAAYAMQYSLYPTNLAVGAVIGGLNGFALSALEIFLQAGGAALLRRLAVLPLLALRTLLYAAVFLGAGAAGTALARALSPDALSLGIVVRPSLAFSLGVALAFNLVFMLRSLFGPRTLAALLTGRYRRPRSEQRIVLFLDLHDSTQLAERLGDADFHRFLNRVFFDITDPVLAANGEIYRYIGDEIIITWRLKSGARNAACIVCGFAIGDALAGRREEYRSAFAAEPRLRAALHAGPLMVGEMGDVKREIVMLGDTMNTASRIEDACRATGRDFIASQAVLEAVGALPAGVAAAELPGIKLRGKEGEVRLFALTRP